MEKFSLSCLYFLLNFFAKTLFVLPLFSLKLFLENFGFSAYVFFETVTKILFEKKRNKHQLPFSIQYEFKKD